MASCSPSRWSIREDEQSITWLRRPLHGTARPLADAEELTDLLGATSRLVSVAAAAIARGTVLAQWTTGGSPEPVRRRTGAAASGA